LLHVYLQITLTLKRAIFLILTVLLASCFDEGNCLVSASNVLKIDFKQKTNHSLDDTVRIKSIQFSNYIAVATTDSIIYGLLLPLSSDSSAVTIRVIRRVFVSNAFVNDTLSLKLGFSTYSKVVTTTCGAYTYFHQLNIKNISLDKTSYKLLSSDLIKDPTTSSYATNLQIYY